MISPLVTRVGQRRQWGPIGSARLAGTVGKDRIATGISREGDDRQCRDGDDEYQAANHRALSFGKLDRRMPASHLDDWFVAGCSGLIAGSLAALLPGMARKQTHSA